MERYDELKAYKHENGDCNVPRRCKANPELGIWVQTQRTMYKERKLAEDRVAKLEKLKFQWELRDTGKNITIFVLLQFSYSLTLSILFLALLQRPSTSMGGSIR
jgi:hypothetical protein